MATLVDAVAAVVELPEPSTVMVPALVMGPPVAIPEVAILVTVPPLLAANEIHLSPDPVLLKTCPLVPTPLNTPKVPLAVRF